MSEITAVPLDAIDVEEGFNPRESVEHLDELTASVRAQGILQPLLVVAYTVEGEQRYLLRDGERRLAAAREAGLAEVPVFPREEAGLREAVTANLQRSSMTPLEEARSLERLRKSGMKSTAIAKQLGVAGGWVSGRLALPELPENAQQLVHTGALPLGAAGVLNQIAKVSAPLAGAIATYLDGDPRSAGVLAEDPAHLLRQLMPMLAEERPDVGAVMARNYGGALVGDLPLEEEKLAELKERAAQLLDGYGQEQRFEFTTEVLDAARAYGCLLEYGDEEDAPDIYGHRWVRVVTDPVWLADQVALQLGEREAKVAAGSEREHVEREQRIENGEQPGPDADGRDVGEEDARKAEREAAKAEALEARDANLRLGANLLLKVDSPPIDLETAKLLAHLALAGRSELIARGLVYVDERYQSVERRTLRSGEVREKVSYDGGQVTDEGEKGMYLVTEHVAKHVDQAKTPEEAVGVALRVMLAAHFADQSVVAAGKRQPFSVPGSYPNAHRPTELPQAAIGGDVQVPQLVEKLAGRLKVLPKRMQQQLRDAKAGRKERGR